MIKKMTCILAAFVLAVTMFYVSATPVEAASTVTYQQTTAKAFGLAREKTGKYYIWVDRYEDDYTGKTVSSISRSYDVPSAGPGPTFKTLRKIATYNTYFDDTFVSNGYYIYYVVMHRYNNYGTIYRTNVQTGSCKKILKVNNLNQVEGYYNGRIYYSVNIKNSYGAVYSVNLRSCKVGNKNGRLEKKNFDPTSSFGRYFTGTGLRFDVSNVTNYRYDAKTRKTLKLQSAYTSVATGTGIYYLKLNGWDNDYVIIKTSLNGKNKKTIKYVYDVYPEFIGKRRAIFEKIYEDRAIEIVYKTGKVYGVLW